MTQSTTGKPPDAPFIGSIVSFVYRNHSYSTLTTVPPPPHNDLWSFSLIAVLLGSDRFLRNPPIRCDYLRNRLVTSLWSLIFDLSRMSKRKRVPSKVLSTMLCEEEEERGVNQCYSTLPSSLLNSLIWQRVITTVHCWLKHSGRIPSSQTKDQRSIFSRPLPYTLRPPIRHRVTRRRRAHRVPLQPQLMPLLHLLLQQPLQWHRKHNVKQRNRESDIVVVCGNEQWSMEV